MCFTPDGVGACWCCRELGTLIAAREGHTLVVYLEHGLRLRLLFSRGDSAFGVQQHPRYTHIFSPWRSCWAASTWLGLAFVGNRLLLIVGARSGTVLSMSSPCMSVGPPDWIDIACSAGWKGERESRNPFTACQEATLHTVTLCGWERRLGVGSSSDGTEFGRTVPASPSRTTGKHAPGKVDRTGACEKFLAMSNSSMLADVECLEATPMSSTAFLRRAAPRCAALRCVALRCTTRLEPQHQAPKVP